MFAGHLEIQRKFNHDSELKPKSVVLRPSIKSAESENNGSTVHFGIRLGRRQKLEKEEALWHTHISPQKQAKLFPLNEAVQLNQA